MKHISSLAVATLALFGFTACMVPFIRMFCLNMKWVTFCNPKTTQHNTGFGAGINKIYSLNPDSGYNGGSCPTYSPCADLYYAISYANGYTSTSQNITFYLGSDNGTSFQTWNNTYIIYEQDTSFVSNFDFKGEGVDNTTVEW